MYVNYSKKKKVFLSSFTFTWDVGDSGIQLQTFPSLPLEFWKEKEFKQVSFKYSLEAKLQKTTMFEYIHSSSRKKVLERQSDDEFGILM